MIQPIMKDVLFLGQKSEKATEQDRQICMDLRDTLAAHRDHCVGDGSDTDAVSDGICKEH